MSSAAKVRFGLGLVRIEKTNLTQKNPLESMPCGERLGWLGFTPPSRARKKKDDWGHTENIFLARVWKGE